jgi:hypothetical protein
VREHWARALASGIDDALFWGMSPMDTAVLMSELREREGQFQRAANLRAGLIAATIANTTPGVRKRYRPSDFFPDEHDGVVDDVDALRSALIDWGRRDGRVRFA